MSLDLLQIAGSLGVGAFLGLIIFIMYRIDRLNSERRLREDRKFMEDRLTKIIGADQKTRGRNTKALTELTVLLRKLNGNAKG